MNDRQLSAIRLRFVYLQFTRMSQNPLLISFYESVVVYRSFYISSDNLSIVRTGIRCEIQMPESL